MIHDCSICAEIAGVKHKDFSNEFGELVSSGRTKLLETNNFIVTPSLGALNESHLLIISKRHYNSMALTNAGHSNELESIIQLIRKYNKTTFNRETAFYESGAGTQANLSGACVTHAHIHALICTSKLESLLLKDIPFTAITFNELYTKANTRRGYALYINSNNSVFICNEPDTPSQYFRFIYAKSNALTTGWNWKKNAHIDNIKKVITVYSNLKSSLSSVIKQTS